MPRDAAITFRDIAGKLTVLRVECDKCGRRGSYPLGHVRINGSTAMHANVPHGGSSAASESLSASTVEGAVLRRAQSWAIALIGGQLGDMTDGHDLIYRRSPQEAAARRKRIYGSARYKPRQPGGRRRWSETRRQGPFAGKPKKRRAGPGCRYKPAAPKWKPGLRDVDTTFRGSSWSA
jgi:hypothetical protein